MWLVSGTNFLLTTGRMHIRCDCYKVGLLDSVAGISGIVMATHNIIYVSRSNSAGMFMDFAVCCVEFIRRVACWKTFHRFLLSGRLYGACLVGIRAACVCTRVVSRRFLTKAKAALWSIRVGVILSTREADVSPYTPERFVLLSWRLWFMILCVVVWQYWRRLVASKTRKQHRE